MDSIDAALSAGSVHDISWLSRVFPGERTLPFYLHLIKYFGAKTTSITCQSKSETDENLTVFFILFFSKKVLNCDHKNSGMPKILPCLFTMG